jgi:hypothetical protein
MNVTVGDAQGDQWLALIRFHLRFPTVHCP